ncbi:MAG: hydrogenase, partial [Atribacterota bacterium]
TDATVVNAMAYGKKAAHSIHQYFNDMRTEQSEERIAEGEKIHIVEEPPVIQNIARVKVPELPVRERVCTFAEVKLGLSEKDARREAERCLRCDLEKRLKKLQQLVAVEEEEG